MINHFMKLPTFLHPQEICFSSTGLLIIKVNLYPEISIVTLASWTNAAYAAATPSIAFHARIYFF